VKWPLLDVLTEEQSREVLRIARRRKFAKGQAIFHEGDPGETLHLVDKGKVAVRIITPLGETATLRILAPGDFFGEIALISPGPRMASVEALEATETLGLHRTDFEDLRQRHPGVDRVLLEAALSEVKRLSVALVDALYVPVPKRLARRLLELATMYGGAGGTPPTITLTQDDLAGLCGTTRPTVNQTLMQLQDEGVVSLARGRITVLDQARLQRAAR
jgi:CRP-like cAMP-binding protein